MQVVSTKFTELATGQVRPLNWKYKMSFDKAYDDSTKFFTLDVSILDGPDLLAPTGSQPIQAWDFYKYVDYTDRVVSLEWTRQLEFPYSVTSAMADIKLNNYDGYFTPKSSSPISDYIIPKRPLRFFAGFGSELLPQLVGITETMPDIDKQSGEVTFHAMDFLSEFYTLETNEILAMQDARTDEVLEALFDLFGLASSMYSLDEGLNVIPFLFYEKGTLASKILRDLMQAEMGNLWLDESGIIRFSNRYATLGSSVATFDGGSIVDISVPDKDYVINKIKINSKVRELQNFQSIWNMAENGGSEIVIGAGHTFVTNISLQDPCKTINNPTIGLSSSDSWFTAIKTSDSSSVTSNITVTGQSLKANNLTLFFSNTNAFEIKVDAMELWGEPAIVIDNIVYKDFNQPSIDKYGEKLLEINNDFIQSTAQCQSLSVPILFFYGQYANQIQIEIKSNPALQLNDVITIDYAPYSGNYRIVKSIIKLNGSKMTQILTCITTEVLKFFTLDESILDGPDVLGL